jgi:hypothetical protein
MKRLFLAASLIALNASLFASPALALAATPVVVSAWGNTGHRMVGGEGM